MSNEYDIIKIIEAQLHNGYLDISDLYDKEEFDIVCRAIEEYKHNHYTYEE